MEITIVLNEELVEYIKTLDKEKNKIGHLDPQLSQLIGLLALAIFIEERRQLRDDALLI